MKAEIETLKKEVKIVFKILDIEKKNENTEIQKDISQYLENNMTENRFSKVYIEQNMIDPSNIQILVNECTKPAFFNDSNTYDITKIDKISPMISNIIYDSILPKIVELYSLKSSLHICFKIVDLIVIKNNVDKVPLNFFTKKTLFSVCIPLQDNNSINFSNDVSYETNSSDIIIYCGNKENYSNNIGEYFIILNIDMEYYS